MKLPTREELAERLKNARVSKRLMRDIRYVPEEITYPGERDFLTVFDKSRSRGVMLYNDGIFTIELARRTAGTSGRVEATICDICATWQRGSNSAVLTFKRTANSSVSYLVCADLDCSLHVRNLTDAAKLSRTQLREHMTVERRIERLANKLTAITRDITGV